ncbi:hypothetical protein HC891_12760 [Candidatus Gracilibacteria bacterium]|nr:hypothetical protein [Candidatus Gracilibacteria bacterium]
MLLIDFCLTAQTSRGCRIIETSGYLGSSTKESQGIGVGVALPCLCASSHLIAEGGLPLFGL